MNILRFSINDRDEATKVVSSLRAITNPREVPSRVADIIAAVGIRGDSEVLDLTRRFDSRALAKPDDLLVTSKEIEAAYSRMDRSSISALKAAVRQIRAVSRKQISRFKEVRFETPLGFRITESYVPLERIGGYVPGGLAAYPSTVLMICIPARVAGVREISIASPARSDGSIPDSVLAATYLGGATRVYKIGGAQAIAAMALGTRYVSKVDLIVGPGNDYVTEAKKQLSTGGKVLIDGLAGPTELLILADESTNPVYVIEDLISQAEHGNRTLCGVATTSRETLESVLESVSSIASRRSRGEYIAQSLLYGVLAQSEDLLADFSQLLSPEHVQVMTRNPKRLAKKISAKASLTMMGDFAPCAATDYVVGTNHILPTGGEAAFHSGLSVSLFLKRSTLVEGNRNSLRRSSRYISSLANLEGFSNHAAAPLSRFEEREVR